MPSKERPICDYCDGTGCPCWRGRDWYSIELGCHAGCPQCGENTCGPGRMPEQGRPGANESKPTARDRAAKGAA